MKTFIQFNEDSSMTFNTITGTSLYRKPSKIGDVEEWASDWQLTRAMPVTYTVFDVIKLDANQFKTFYRNPLRDQDYFTYSNEYLKKLIEAHLIPLSRKPVAIVSWESRDPGRPSAINGVIVDTQGSSYARYVALGINDGKPSLRINPPATPERKDLDAYFKRAQERARAHVLNGVSLSYN